MKKKTKKKENQWFEVIFDHPTSVHLIHYGIYSKNKKDAIKEVKQKYPRGSNFK